MQQRALVVNRWVIVIYATPARVAEPRHDKPQAPIHRIWSRLTPRDDAGL